MIVAVTHGYVPGYSMGGEVSLHRTLAALHQPVTVLTRTPQPYALDGIAVQPITVMDVLNPDADPAPLVWQLARLNAHLVIAQNELAGPAVKAAHALGIPCVVSVHTPPKFGRRIRQSIIDADAIVANTQQAATEWRHPHTLVLHPPISPLPPRPARLPQGDAYTLLSNLANKGAKVALTLAEHMPDQRFIIVRSPAEPTHGLEGFDAWAKRLPNVEVKPRVEPDKVATEYLSQTRIVLAPSRYETYGLAALEAAGHGIPTVHVDTPHVREGIGEAAYLVPPLGTEETRHGLEVIEADYDTWSQRARYRVEAVMERQHTELAAWNEWLPNVRRRHPRS